jgi:hypothetical protein
MPQNALEKWVGVKREARRFDADVENTATFLR